MHPSHLQSRHPQPLQRAMVECREQAQRMAPVASATTMGERNWGLWPLCRKITRRAPDARAFAAMPLTPQRTLQNALCAGTDFVATQPGMWLLFMSHTPDHKRTSSASSSSNFISTANTKRQLCTYAPEHKAEAAMMSVRVNKRVVHQKRWCVQVVHKRAFQVCLVPALPVSFSKQQAIWSAVTTRD